MSLAGLELGRKRGRASVSVMKPADLRNRRNSAVVWPMGRNHDAECERRDHEARKNE